MGEGVVVEENVLRVDETPALGPATVGEDLAAFSAVTPVSATPQVPEVLLRGTPLSTPPLEGPPPT